MMKMFRFFFIVVVLFLVVNCHPPADQVYQDLHLRQADSLLQLLTLEEKAGQMTNISLTALTDGPFWTDADTLPGRTTCCRKTIRYSWA